MVGIAGNQNHEIELSYCGKLVCFKGKPYIYPLLYYSDVTASLDFPEMLIVEYHIVFDEGIFKFSLTVKEVFAIGIIHPVATTEIMTLSDMTFRSTATAYLRYLSFYEGHKAGDINVH